jgi:hypothetical protein
MPPKNSSHSPDTDALPDAVERLADEVQTLRTALDEFQDSFACELRRLRDVLAEIMGHRPEVNAEDPAMAIDGVRSAARQVERAAKFPGETPGGAAGPTSKSASETSSTRVLITDPPAATTASLSTAAVSPTPANSDRLF